MARLPVILSFLVFCSVAATAQQKITIIPEPVAVEKRPGNFLLHGQIHINSNYSTREAYQFFAGFLRQHYNLEIFVNHIRGNTRPYKNERGSINLIQTLSPADHSAYVLTVSDSNIVIEGSERGIFYGIQSLIQLLPAERHVPKHDTLQIPCVKITDAARFAYRGVHLDVARHFFNPDEIRKFIDYLALHKINTFHWHLTDDQGWRIEIKKYPNLTVTGSCRNQTLVGPFGTNRYDGKKYCGFYTQQEIREIVRYARDRFISIIPEIDMPGHAAAALTAYPFLGCTKGPYQTMETWGVAEESLCAGNDSTYQFVTAVLDELIDLFPGEVIHIGGDECVKKRWAECKSCQQKIKREKLAGENELQDYFVNRIVKYLRVRGRIAIGWDEILHNGLPGHARIMSWRGEKGGIEAAKKGHYVVMSPESPLYLNHAQSRNEDSVTQGGYNPIEALVAYDPVPLMLDENERKFILGPQGNLWSEYIPNFSKLEYQLFPRLAALAEMGWTMQAKRSWKNFEPKISDILNRYQRWGINFSNAYFDLQPEVVSKNGQVAWQLSSKHHNGEILLRNAGSPGQTFVYQSPLVISQSGTWEAAWVGQNAASKSAWLAQAFVLHKGCGKKIRLAEPPDQSYSEGGAFTLLNAVRNTKGMARSTEFLGYWGRDIDAYIDLGTTMQVDSMAIHIFEQPESWIYRPETVTFFGSNDEKNFQLLGKIGQTDGARHLTYKFLCPGSSFRFIRILATNFGRIPDSLPGGGNKAWLFADEISIW